MPDEAAAVLEAPETEVPALETTETVETPEQTAETEGQSQEIESSGEQLKGSALWRETKANLDANKPLTPQQVAGIRKAIHRAEELDRRYPDGLNHLDSTFQAVQKLADSPGATIEQVIEQTLQEKEYFREFDDLYTNGKAEFVDKLADADGAAFQQIAPAVFRKFAELNPDGFSSYVSQAVLNHFNSAEVPLQFQILRAFLPQLPESPATEQIKNACESIFGAFDALRQFASKPVTSKDFKPQVAEQQTTNQPDQGLDLTRREWNLSVQQEGMNLVLSEAQKAAGKQQLSEKEKQKVVSLVAEEMDARLAVNKNYGEAMQGYLRNGNKAAYLQRIRSERKQIVPNAVRRAVEDVLAARPKAAPKQQAQNPAQPQRQQNGQFQGTEYRRIAGHPKTLGMVVDLNRTTQSMLLKKHAYIKGEQKPVQWA